MARARSNVPLNVFLNGRLVGHLNRETSGAIDFRYASEWLEWQEAIPVSLSLPLREDRYFGGPVIAVFDNLLPDNIDIRRRVAQRAGATGADAHSLLAAIGRDCIGALQFIPDGISAGRAGTIDARRVTDEEIGEILGDLGRSPLGIGEDREFRISIAGTQEKTALLYWNDAWHVPHGTTPTSHILKPQIGRLRDGIDLSRSVENEHFCLKLVGALGLPVAPSRIADFAGHRTLVVERFDRLWTTDRRLLRMPQEDCCQALSVPPEQKYEAEGGPGIVEIARLLEGSDTPDIDRRAFFKAQLIFWLLGATDGHAKNVSIRLSSGGRFVLAPLYDVLSAQPNRDAQQIRQNQMKLAMAVGTTRHYVMHTIQPRHFLQTAKLCGLPARTATSIFDELVTAAPASIEQTLSEVPADFPQDMAHSIVQAALSRLALLADKSLRDA